MYLTENDISLFADFGQLQTLMKEQLPHQPVEQNNVSETYTPEMLSILQDFLIKEHWRDRQEKKYGRKGMWEAVFDDVWIALPQGENAAPMLDDWHKEFMNSVDPSSFESPTDPVKTRWQELAENLFGFHLNLKQFTPANIKHLEALKNLQKKSLERKDDKLHKIISAYLASLM